MADIVDISKARRASKAKPTPRAAALLSKPGPVVDARSILESALENHKSIDNIVLLITDHDGNLGLISNLDGAAENLLFIEGAKARIVAAQFDNGRPIPPPETA